MGQDLYNLTCPCCGAVLEVDAATQTILTHRVPKPASVPQDLQEAVNRLKAEQGTRDQRFREQVDRSASTARPWKTDSKDCSRKRVRKVLRSPDYATSTSTSRYQAQP